MHKSMLWRGVAALRKYGAVLWMGDLLLPLWRRRAREYWIRIVNVWRSGTEIVERQLLADSVEKGAGLKALGRSFRREVFAQ